MPTILDIETLNRRRAALEADLRTALIDGGANTGAIRRELRQIAENIEHAETRAAAARAEAERKRAKAQGHALAQIVAGIKAGIDAKMAGLEPPPTIEES